MLTLTERLSGQHQATTTLTLPFDQRQKSRLRARLDNGKEVALLLERGTVLRDGDYLRADSGLIIKICAAPETVSTAHTELPQQLVRAAYHLGNRHVALQIGHAWVRYQHDHVLDGMVRELGLLIKVEQLPFEPEAGAYAQAGHGHRHEPAH